MDSNVTVTINYPYTCVGVKEDSRAVILIITALLPVKGAFPVLLAFLALALDIGRRSTTSSVARRTPPTRGLSVALMKSTGRILPMAR